MNIPQPTTEPVIEGNVITLPPDWMAYGEVYAHIRNYTATLAGKVDMTYRGHDPVQIHIDGVQGELAFHMWLTGSGFEPTCGTYKAQADVGEDLEIRCRVHKGESWPKELIVRRNDDPAKRYVLIVRDHTLGANTFDVKGWVWGYEAHEVEPKNHGRHNPAHFVPYSMLHDPAGLRA
jgi:hypothetical protein